jgi:hypothetical protein
MWGDDLRGHTTGNLLLEIALNRRGFLSVSFEGLFKPGLRVSLARLGACLDLGFFRANMTT